MRTWSHYAAEPACITLFPADTSLECCCPVLSGPVPAGFPSPAVDFGETGIDLNRELISRPSSTFFGRVKGDSMRDAGISDGDLLVIDKAREPVQGCIAVCCLDGEFTLKRLHLEQGQYMLLPANPAYPPIPVAPGQDFRVWGVVSYVIKAC